MSFVAKILQIDYMRHSRHILPACQPPPTSEHDVCIYSANPVRHTRCCFLSQTCTAHKVYLFSTVHTPFCLINAAVVTHVLEFHALFHLVLFYIHCYFRFQAINSQSFLSFHESSIDSVSLYIHYYYLLVLHSPKANSP